MSGEINSFKDLKVWQEAIELAKTVYKITSNFPQDEKFGLSSQMKRSSVSVSSNIAEGSRRGGTKELINFINIALGSLAEVETQVIIAYEVGICKQIDKEDIGKRCEVIGKMLVKLRQSLLKKL